MEGRHLFRTLSLAFILLCVIEGTRATSSPGQGGVFQRRDVSTASAHPQVTIAGDVCTVMVSSNIPIRSNSLTFNLAAWRRSR